jgi:hypothetical protein
MIELVRKTPKRFLKKACANTKRIGLRIEDLP